MVKKKFLVKEHRDSKEEPPNTHLYLGSGSGLAGGLDKAANGIGRLGTTGCPIVDTVELDVELARRFFVARSIGPNDLNKTAITTSQTLGNNHTILRVLLGTPTL